MKLARRPPAGQTDGSSAGGSDAAANAVAMAPAATTSARRPVPRRRSTHRAGRRGGGPGIRWDRIGRVGLLGVLGVIVLLYISPLTHWIAQSRTADDYRTELRELERENADLKSRARDLSRPESLEREARKLGMVRRGEKAFAVENLPSR